MTYVRLKAADMRDDTPYVGRTWWPSKQMGRQLAPAAPNPNGGSADTSTSTSSVTATYGRMRGVGAGAIELFQPTQLWPLQSRQPLRSLEPLAKPAC